MSALKYWIWLSMAEGLTNVGKKMLLNSFETPEKIFFATENDYKAVGGLTERDIKALSHKSLTQARKAIEDCREMGIEIITIQDADYPSRLKNIFDPPLVLYMKGKLRSLDDEAAVAVVGTRKCTQYGYKTAKKIGFELAATGCTVVTGLAAGIDSAAAIGALNAGGKVVGVLGCGPDVVYPAENKKLYDAVIKDGVLISEYAPGEKPERWHFPARNRIISGISLGVAVVEAPEKSGALITAHQAVEQGRDVFTVPGNVDSYQSAGCYQLLREGAIPVSGGLAIAEEYIHMFPDKLGIVSRTDVDTSEIVNEDENIAVSEKETVSNKAEAIDKTESLEYIDVCDLPDCVTETERKVFEALGREPVMSDEIIEKTGIPAGDVLSSLTMLQIYGCIEQGNGQRFSRVKK